MILSADDGIRLVAARPLADNGGGMFAVPRRECPDEAGIRPWLGSRV
ncbi:hypothetical protein ACWD3I_46810 [Streptomyces sp. NPDC002817]